MKTVATETDSASPRKPQSNHEWIRDNPARVPKTGSRWRSHRGKTVTVLAVGVREDTGRVFVAFEEDGDVWSVPLTDWNATTNSGGRTLIRYKEET